MILHSMPILTQFPLKGQKDLEDYILYSTEYWKQPIPFQDRKGGNYFPPQVEGGDKREKTWQSVTPVGKFLWQLVNLVVFSLITEVCDLVFLVSMSKKPYSTYHRHQPSTYKSKLVKRLSDLIPLD